MFRVRALPLGRLTVAALACALAVPAAAAAKPSARAAPAVVNPGQPVVITGKGLRKKTRYKVVATLVGSPIESPCLYQQFVNVKSTAKGRLKATLSGASDFEGTWCRGRRYRVEIRVRTFFRVARTSFAVSGTVPTTG